MITILLSLYRHNSALEFYPSFSVIILINFYFYTKGLVTHEMLELKTKTYNVTIRAINQADLHRDTWVVITVKGQLPQLFYQYDMKLSDIETTSESTSQSPGLARQISLVNLLNQYLNYAAVNVVEYQDMVNNQFNLVWSVCPLPTKCTTKGWFCYHLLFCLC